MSLVSNWIETHSKLNLPTIPLFLVAISIRLVSGNASSLSRIEEDYKRYYSKEDNCMFLDYLHGVEKMQESSYKEAVAIFDGVIGFSSLVFVCSLST